MDTDWLALVARGKKKKAMTKGTDSHSGKKVHSLGVGHALTGSGAVVYLGFLCPAGSRARL